MVSEQDTASALGSGDVPSVGTPRVLSLCEEATVAAVTSHLGEGETTVGIKVKLDHINPTPIGAEITAEAQLVEVKGRQLTFTVAATDGHGLIAVGRVTRVIIDRDRFLNKLADR